MEKDGQSPYLYFLHCLCWGLLIILFWVLQFIRDLNCELNFQIFQNVSLWTLSLRNSHSWAWISLKVICNLQTIKSLTYSLFIVRQFSCLSYVIEFKYPFMPGAVLGADDTNSIKAWGVWSRRMDRLAGEVWASHSSYLPPSNC